MATGGNNLLNEYYLINNKLKRKRILKTPFIAEACENYDALGARSEGNGDLLTAALCNRSASQCSTSVGQHKHSAVQATKAARLFMLQEKGLKANGLVSTGELLHASVSSYHQAKDRWGERDSVVAGCLALELATNLIDLDRSSSALVELQNAAIWFKKHPSQRLQCLHQIMELHVRNENYEAALEVCSLAIKEAEPCVKTFACSKESFNQMQIDRILLLLIVKPSQMGKDEQKVLEQLSSNEDKSSESWNESVLSGLDEEVVILLQSLVMAVEDGDGEILSDLEGHLLPFVTPLEAQLLRTLRREAC